MIKSAFKAQFKHRHKMTTQKSLNTCIMVIICTQTQIADYYKIQIQYKNSLSITADQGGKKKSVVGIIK